MAFPQAKEVHQTRSPHPFFRACGQAQLGPIFSKKLDVLRDGAGGIGGVRGVRGEGGGFSCDLGAVGLVAVAEPGIVSEDAAFSGVQAGEVGVEDPSVFLGMVEIGAVGVEDSRYKVSPSYWRKLKFDRYEKKVQALSTSAASRTVLPVGQNRQDAHRGARAMTAIAFRGKPSNCFSKYSLSYCAMPVPRLCVSASIADPAQL